MPERAGENDYRHALMQVERALMHAEKWLADDVPSTVLALVRDARAEASRVLDIGRDEANEMVGDMRAGLHQQKRTGNDAREVQK